MGLGTGASTRGDGRRAGRTAGKEGAAGRGDRRGDGCGPARLVLCRLAAGDGAGDAGPGLARHARTCGACRRFADTLASVRSWLDDTGRAGVSPLHGRPRQARRARAALARELSARLARDLMDLAEARPLRSLESRRRDVHRLRRLGRDGAADTGPWASAVPVLLEQARLRNRASGLALARAMDPCGVDVALAHLGHMVRRGEGVAADRDADGLLLRIG